MLYLWLQSRFNITYVYPQMKHSAWINKNALTFLNSYDRVCYWLMCLESDRLNAYEEAVRQCQQQQQKSIWLDVGTGDQMPLTRLLIKHEVAKHVYAVEANHETYQRAKKFRHHLSDKEKEKISLYNYYSTDIDWQTHDSPPNAIIHDIIGTVCSEEGCIKVMHDTVKNLGGNVRLCIPYRIGTLCMPVTRPKVSILSSLFSLFFSQSTTLGGKSGIQWTVNPPKDAFLCETPQFIEKFVLMEYATKPLDKCTTVETKFIVEKNAAEWTGFYLAPHILTAKDNKNGLAEIDGLKQKTAWGVNYVHMFDDQQPINVKQGDEIHVVFQSDLTDECPRYRLEAWVNNDYIFRTSVVWKGWASAFF